MIARQRLETQLGEVGIEATETACLTSGFPGRRRSPGLRAMGAPRSTRCAPRRSSGSTSRASASEFELELDWAGVDAEHRRVLETLCEAAPFGETITYGELGRAAGVDDPRDVGVLHEPESASARRPVPPRGRGGRAGRLRRRARAEAAAARARGRPAAAPRPRLGSREGERALPPSGLSHGAVSGASAVRKSAVRTSATADAVPSPAWATS